MFPFHRGRAAATAALLLALAAGAAGSAHAQDPMPPAAAPGEAAVPAGFVVEQVEVRGNDRTTEAGIRGTAGLEPGAVVGPSDVADAVRRLMASGQYADAAVFVRGADAGRGTLVIAVQERPFITQIAFEGLESIRGSAVRDSAGLRENAPLNPQRVTLATRLIRDMLAARGVQTLAVDTVLTPVEGAGNRLTFRVTEGPRLAIADVQFVGNQAFTNDQLRGAMDTRREGFWWFRTGRFDRETFRRDLGENLPDYYGARGYIDFAVVSDTLVVDPVTGKARLVVEVHEGPQYRLGEIDVRGNQRFPTETLTATFTAQRRSVLGLPFGRQGERETGEIFDRPALDRATSEIRQMYSNEGYLFANVIPVVDRVPGEHVVNVTLAVSEHQPFYIRNISFEGNVRTHEAVLRERLWILPGDVYSEARLMQSYQALAGLGFFEVPMPIPSINPNPETGEVNITFHVVEKQTGNINFGTVFGGNYGGRRGGFAGFLGYQQPNLFGQAKQANLRAEYGYGRSTLEASYTDPSLFGGRNSGSVSVFRMGDRYFRVGGGRRLRTGASTQFGFPVPGALRTRAFIGYSLSQTQYDADADVCEPGSLNVFCLPSATASTVSGSLARDTKNHPLFPTSGTRQSLSVEQTGGPMGGDGNFQKLLVNGEWWAPVARLGTGPRPAQMALGVQARAGAIFGDVGRFPFERFYVGGTQFGQPLRGYQEASIGPRGYRPECSGQLQLDCLGDAFITISGEYALRLTDAVSVSAFADAGNVFRSVGEFNTTRLFRSLGIGGTLVTPFLGAIGVDAAYGFDRTDPGWEIHFKLGGM